MSNSVTITGHKELMESLHDALIGVGRPGDAATVVKDEARLWLKQVIRLTPPKTKQQGEDRIERDLHQIFTPVNADMADDIAIEHGTNNIDIWLTTAGGQSKHLKWDRIDATGAGMKEFHRRNLTPRGQTKNLKRGKRDNSVWYSPFVVTFEDFASFLKKQQAKVGRRKAGWGVGYRQLGGMVAKWMDRHVTGAKGFCLNGLGSQNSPNVILGNYSPGINDDLRVCQSAMRIRGQAMTRRLKLLLSGYSQDVARGLKVMRRERPSPMEVVE